MSKNKKQKIKKTVKDVEPDMRDLKKENASPDELEQPESDFSANPAIAAYIEKQVAEGVKKALQGKPPKANAGNFTEQQQKSFEKMTYKERLNLFKTNPLEYNKLAKGAK